MFYSGTLNIPVNLTLDNIQKEALTFHRTCDERLNVLPFRLLYKSLPGSHSEVMRSPAQCGTRELTKTEEAPSFHTTAWAWCHMLTPLECIIPVRWRYLPALQPPINTPCPKYLVNLIAILNVNVSYIILREYSLSTLEKPPNTPRDICAQADSRSLSSSPSLILSLSLPLSPSFFTTVKTRACFPFLLLCNTNTLRNRSHRHHRTCDIR